MWIDVKIVGFGDLNQIGLCIKMNQKLIDFLIQLLTSDLYHSDNNAFASHIKQQFGAKQSKISLVILQNWLKWLNNHIISIFTQNQLNYPHFNQQLNLKQPFLILKISLICDNTNYVESTSNTICDIASCIKSGDDIAVIIQIGQSDSIPKA